MFLMDDYDAALRDIRATLAREPRHYGALAGLGMIMQRMDNPKAAFAAFERALRIHPHLESIKDATERLKLDVEDKKI
jgi:Tfp pilus assembly protein PilF